MFSVEQRQVVQRYWWLHRRRWRWFCALALCAALLGGCLVRPLGHATPTPGPQAPKGPDLFTPTVPGVAISPTRGGPDTEVTVNASGFPAGWRLLIYVSQPGAGNPKHPYGEGTSDEHGRVKMTFPMPAAWPDGRPITETKLLVIVATQDFYTRAQAEFAYAPQP